MPDQAAPMLFGLRAVMLGRQGSGKGTQGMQLSRLLVVPHVSVGCWPDCGRGFPRTVSPSWRGSASRSRPDHPPRRTRT